MPQPVPHTTDVPTPRPVEAGPLVNGQSTPTSGLFLYSATAVDISVSGLKAIAPSRFL